jgi:peptide/nickel transport system substrate-binding protein
VQMFLRREGGRLSRPSMSVGFGLTIVMLVLGGLGACSGADPGASPVGSGSAQLESDVDPNGVVRVGYPLAQQGGLPVRLDPLTAKADAANNDPLWYLVYGRFMRPTHDGGLEPDLAERVEATDDTTIVVSLREGLTFSDGSPFDAEAVKTGLEAVLDAREENSLAYQPTFFALESVEVTDARTVTLSIPDGTAASWFDQYIPTFATSIVKVSSDPDELPIGAGPFRLVAVEQGESWTLEKNHSYWNADSIQIAGVELLNIAGAQPQAALAAVQAGQVDAAFSEPALLGSLGGRTRAVTRVSSSRSVNLHICKSDGPLADPRVRQAINRGLDREAINTAVYDGLAEPAVQVWPAEHRLHNPDAAKLLSYDPDGARALLHDAGYGDGLEIDLHALQVLALDQVAEVIQAQLADIGITIQIIPATDYVGKYLEPNTRGLGLYPSFSSGRQALASWSGDSIANACDYSNPEIDRLVEALSTVSERSDAAVALWHDVTEIIAREALGGFLVFTPTTGTYNTDRLGNVEPWPMGNYLVPDPATTYVKAQ